MLADHAARVLRASVVVATLAASPVWAASESVVYAFKGGTDGGYPVAALINVGGTLYGTTSGGGGSFNCSLWTLFGSCGTVFSVTPAGVETVLYAFKGTPDGANPVAALTAFHGALYGTTEYGGSAKYLGSYGVGTVFKVTADNVETVVHRFGAIAFEAYPMASLVAWNGLLYGTDFGRVGGSAFSLTRNGYERQLHSFGIPNDGQNPATAMVYLRGEFYGTTSRGTTGGQGGGVVYTMAPNGNESVLYQFYNDYASPSALTNLNGTLYGTTPTGGTFTHCTNGCGTVFSITPSGAYTLLHSFGSGGDGAAPMAGLVRAGGALYGTTSSGGVSGACASGCGTVFKITPAGKESVIHSFQGGTDGAVPEAAMVNVSGTLYGTTYQGGGSTYCYGGCGIVFAIQP